jgi:hypothetical protein
MRTIKIAAPESFVRVASAKNASINAGKNAALESARQALISEAVESGVAYTVESTVKAGALRGALVKTAARMGKTLAFPTVDQKSARNAGHVGDDESLIILKISGSCEPAATPRRGRKPNPNKIVKVSTGKRGRPHKNPIA